MESPVTHDLLYQSYGLCSVSLIKEDNSVKIFGAIFLCLSFSLMQKVFNVLL